MGQSANKSINDGHHVDLKGLTEAGAAGLLKKYGSNSLHLTKPRRLRRILLDILKEPMMLLLLFAAVLYFLLGSSREGTLMLLAICFVAAISFFQDLRSSKAMDALRALTAPMARVIREGRTKVIAAENLVPGDLILLEEGERVPADGTILQAHDLSFNESILSGESLPVDKDASAGQNELFQGATVASGSCVARITATGNNTALGRIGKTMDAIPPTPTHLQHWVQGFIRAMAIFGIAAFLLIWLINFLHTHQLGASLLAGLTLAMSAIPEEIPVAYTSFMALGAFRLTASGIIVRQPRILENLGVLSVICLDKTGTLTENRMQQRLILDANTALVEEHDLQQPWAVSRVGWFARLASEMQPFDPMEQAIVQAFDSRPDHADYRRLTMIREYPLDGHPPMMTHVYIRTRGTVAAAKGAPERIFAVCGLSGPVLDDWRNKVAQCAARGYRVLGVASSENPSKNLPASQDDLPWHFEGLVALSDPPKKGLTTIFDQWAAAGISVKILSGDYAGTVANIAAQTGLPAGQPVITGEELMSMPSDSLSSSIVQHNLYGRMFPQAKMKVIDSLKSSGAAVAMIGDGVNDGPALRSADVGIAMGKKGTEIAKEAADLIIADDNLDKITEAIRYGRSIRQNLGKAVRYLMTIHIPIILTASLPLLLGWTYPTVFTPIHIIFLELIMGPTCSIYYESEPLDPSIMRMPPQNDQSGLFDRADFFRTISLGLSGAIGILALYHHFMHLGFSLPYTRSIVFLTLLTDNILLTFTHRSSTLPLYKTIRIWNPLTPLFLLLSAGFIVLIFIVPFFRALFGLEMIHPAHLLPVGITVLLSVGWYEVYKVWKP